MKKYLRLLQETRSQKGSVFILVALAAMMLITTTGVAVDMARAQILQAKIQMALDAAGLAAGATANTIDVQTQANKYFFANFPTGYMGSGTVTITATISADESTVTLAANTTQATTFMKAVGINSVSVAANTQITRANDGMELVLVLDNTGSMTTVLPGDSEEKIQALKDSINNSGGLLDILYGASNNTAPNLWVGVVPFTDMVNVGNPPPSATGKNWMDTTYENSLDFGPTISGSTCPTSNTITGTHNGSNSSSRCSYSVLTSSTHQPGFGLTNWGGCVTARGSTTSPTNSALTLDESDDLPSSSVSGTLFQPFYYASDSNISLSSTTSCSNKSQSNSRNSATDPWYCNVASGSGSSKKNNDTYYLQSSTLGPNVNCLTTSVLPMVAEKATVENEVNTMSANGETMINLGLAWGYRMLSPNWQGWWGGEMNNTGNSTFPQLPLPYHTALMNKVIVLMTDGMNTTNSYAGYDIGQTPNSPTPAQMDTKAEATCDALKANGVIIYTIGFGTTDNPANSGSSTYVDGTLLKYCATQNYSGDTSHYFLATSSVSLSSAFQQIGAELANLRVSK